METVLLAIEPDSATRLSLKKAFSGLDFYFPRLEPLSIVKEASQRSPDLILMDIEMPVKEGMEIFTMLRTIPDIRDIPIIFMSKSKKPVAFLPNLEGVARTTDLESMKKLVEDTLTRTRMEKSVREAVIAVAPLLGTKGGGTAAGKAKDLTQIESDILQSGGFEAEAQVNYEPLAKYAARYQALLNSCLTVAEAAKKLSVSTGRVRQRLLSKPRELFGIRLNNSWRLPAFQFKKAGLVPNIEQVISQIDPNIDPVAVESWFITANIDLEFEEGNVSPLEWLMMGKDWKQLSELAKNL